MGRPNIAWTGERSVIDRSKATAMASATVSEDHSRASWNDRPRPARVRALAAQLETSRPSSCTRPPSSGTNPVSASKNVVLPAPFGPMIPRISP
jgi:hypothetical protein